MFNAVPANRQHMVELRGTFSETVIMTYLKEPLRTLVFLLKEVQVVCCEIALFQLRGDCGLL